MSSAESTHEPATWGGDRFDLDAYLARIGMTGISRSSIAPEAGIDAVRALQRAHVATIPFENGETILGRSTPLDIESLQSKLVQQRRGGYCYEHTIVFAAALERLGFRVTGLVSRITMGAAHPLPATHAAVKVDAPDGRSWVSDVGRGGGPLEPIELADGAVLQRSWNFRLRRVVETGTEYWILDGQRPEGWLDLHQFTLTPSYPVDYTVGNHYIATHPNSPFARRIVTQKLDEEVWHFLDGTTLTTTCRDGTARTRELDPDEVPKLLEETFDIALSREDASTLISTLTRS